VTKPVGGSVDHDRACTSDRQGIRGPAEGRRAGLSPQAGSRQWTRAESQKVRYGPDPVRACTLYRTFCPPLAGSRRGSEVRGHSPAYRW